MGNVNRRISDLLWNRFCGEATCRGCLRLESAKNEQGYRIDMYGNPRRQVVDYEGIRLIRRVDGDGAEPEGIREDPYPDDLRL